MMRTILSHLLFWPLVSKALHIMLKLTIIQNTKGDHLEHFGPILQFFSISDLQITRQEKV